MCRKETVIYGAAGKAEIIFSVMRRVRCCDRLLSQGSFEIVMISGWEIFGWLVGLFCFS